MAAFAPFIRGTAAYRLARAAWRGALRDDGRLATCSVEAFDPDFVDGDSAYNGLGVGADGRIWFSVACKRLDMGGRIFTFDARSGAVRQEIDLDAALREAGPPSVPHGKVHVDFVEIDGRMHGASHAGHYETADGLERPAEVPGHAAYPGGRFFAIDSGGMTPLGTAPGGGGLVTMCADVDRRRLHALTWPHGHLVSLDLASRTVLDRGPVLGAAETGSIRDGSWQRVCRSLGVDPATGHVFWSDKDGGVWRHDDRGRTSVAALPGAQMWRKVCWLHGDRRFVGITEAGRLFAFDPASATVDDLGSLSVAGTRYRARATLAFALDAASRTIHYVAPGPPLWRGIGRTPLYGSSWYMTRHLDSGATHTHGVLRLPDRRVVTRSESLMVHDGYAYSVGWVEVTDTDLSAHAAAVRDRRRDTAEWQSRGYAEEMLLLRWPLA